MKKLIFFLLVLTALLGMNACAETSAQKTKQPEPFVTATLIRDGASDYTIVHDGTSAAKNLAGLLQKTISENFGVALPMEAASEKGEGDFEIVVGNARPVAKKTASLLRKEQDFALKVEEKALVLYAADGPSYQYLGEYLENSVFAKNDTGELTLDSDDNVVYSKTIPVDKNFIEYMREGNESFNWLELFAFKVYKNDDTVLPYRIYVPFNYSPDKKLPVLVNLHGAGLRGNDNVRQLQFLNTMLLREDQQLSDAIIICPQCPDTQKWVDTDWTRGSYSVDSIPESNELKAVVELVEQLKKEYPVDESRIYACGFSMGGYGTWDLLMRHSDLFCAGVAMCGAGDPAKAEVLKTVPVWAIHGGKDPTVPVQGSRDMAQALQSVSAPNAHYTELPDNEHDVWNYTYKNAEIFSWLFAQKKS